MARLCFTIKEVSADSAYCTYDNFDAVAKLDGIADELMKKSGIPGMAVAVVHGGKTVYAKGFGVRDIKTGDKVETASGIRGVVIAVKDNAVTLKSFDSKIEVTKVSVTNILESSAALES